MGHRHALAEEEAIVFLYAYAVVYNPPVYYETIEILGVFGDKKKADELCEQKNKDATAMRYACHEVWRYDLTTGDLVQE